MVPKIHAKGTGFGGIAQYVLHDKDADTSERVAWTETVNLGTRNPHTASRVMMATSMDQDRLKREAGVKTTGRKSKAHVLHVTLSWHADESKELTREEQVRAAKWFMKEIKAGDRQALIVAHNDEPQAHVHLVINRVSPSDGRILSSSMDRIKASTWAEKYERERGKIYCHERVINNAARARGEYVKGGKDLPRVIVEKMAAVSNDNLKKSELVKEHRSKAAAIAKQQRAVRDRHRKEWQGMETNAKNARNKLQHETKLEAVKARQGVRDSFRQKWAEHHHEQQAGQAHFNLNEKSLRGRIENAKQLVQWRNLIGKKSEGQRVSSIKNAFRVFASEGARRDALAKQHKRQEVKLKNEQRDEEKAVVDRVKSKLPTKQTEQSQAYKSERESLITKHRLEAAKVKATWKTFEAKRDKAWAELRSDGKDAVLKKRAADWVASNKAKTKSSNILPSEGIDAAATKIDRYQQRLIDQARKDATGRQASNDNDRGEDRGR